LAEWVAKEESAGVEVVVATELPALVAVPVQVRKVA